MIGKSLAMDEDKEFHKLQYTALRTLIAQQYDKQYWWLIYVSSANGAIYFSLAEKFTQTQYAISNALLYGLLIASILITVFGFVLFTINVRTAQLAINYCTETERLFLKQG